MSELKPNVRTAWEFPPQSRVVLASDYDALQQRCAELENQRNEAAEAAGNTAAANHKLLTERDALRSRCSELYEANNQRSAAHSQTIKERDALRAEIEALRRDAARYERLRRLNPRQFADLFERNLKGERFDDLIDQMEAAPGSWQAGYDKGRADGVKFRLGELEQERRIAAELQAVALRLIKTYVTDDAHDDRRALEGLSRMRQEVNQ